MCEWMFVMLLPSDEKKTRTLWRLKVIEYMYIKDCFREYLSWTSSPSLVLIEIKGKISAFYIFPQKNYEPKKIFNVVVIEGYWQHVIVHGGLMTAYTAGASSQWYWDEVSLLKCEIISLKSQINTNMNKNGFRLPSKCLEGVLKYSYLVQLFFFKLCMFADF